MRLPHLIFGDLKFQSKSGFYLLYTVLTAIYLIVLFTIPLNLKEKITGALIFSDPSALGLFFMGAIVLLEKSQRVSCAFAVSPIKATEYVCSKVISLGVISLTVAAILAICTKFNHIGITLIGTFLSSVMFTLIGIIIATKINTLNQFIIATVPIEIIGLVPAIIYLFWQTDNVISYYPPNTCMDLIMGKTPSIIGMLFTLIIILILFVFAKRAVEKMWMEMGGAKL